MSLLAATIKHILSGVTLRDYDSSEITDNTQTIPFITILALAAYFVISNFQAIVLPIFKVIILIILVYIIP